MQRLEQELRSMPRVEELSALQSQIETSSQEYDAIQGKIR